VSKSVSIGVQELIQSYDISQCQGGLLFFEPGIKFFFLLFAQSCRISKEMNN